MPKVLSGISFIMLLIAITFFIYALNHPEGFIIIPIIGTKGLYIIYSIVAIGMFVMSRFLKKDKK